jgi:hypothetical protein
MSQVMSLRLQDHQMQRLGRLARRLGRTKSETGVLLIEEALRMAEFGHIVFRDSPAGRQAYVMGTSLAVWEVVFVARDYGGDPVKTAHHLHWPLVRVQAALAYAEAFPDEIEAAIADNDARDFTTLKQMLPQAEMFVASGTAADLSDEGDAAATPG